jgi:protein-tyrosine-phosphatase/DNA-binding transcriptional ArsR family regulator
MDQAAIPGAAPPAFLQLAGHPLRWRLLSELAHSDRAVRELIARLEEPQNLVSYHLAKLRQGGLVTARRSSADRRDTYYGLDLGRVAELLSAAGGALHPALRLAPLQRGLAPAGADTPRILFLCTGNSARSPMAAALAVALSEGRTQALSAGSEPRPLHPNAARVMREDYGLDISGHRATHVDTFAGQTFDWIVSLCDRARDVFCQPPGDARLVHWSLANPAGDESDHVSYPRFRATADLLATRVRFLLAAADHRQAA